MDRVNLQSSGGNQGASGFARVLRPRSGCMVLQQEKGAARTGTWSATVNGRTTRLHRSRSVQSPRPLQDGGLRPLFCPGKTRGPLRVMFRPTRALSSTPLAPMSPNPYPAWPCPHKTASRSGSGTSRPPPIPSPTPGSWPPTPPPGGAPTRARTFWSGPGPGRPQKDMSKCRVRPGCFGPSTSLVMWMLWSRSVPL